MQPDWNIERYLDLLKVLARRLQLDPSLRRLLDSSDLVQETMLKVFQNRGQFKGQTEGEQVKWLQVILLNTFRDKLREVSKGLHGVNLDQLVDKLVMDSSACLESWMTDGQSSPSKQAERHEFLLRLSTALEQLPGAQRDAFILRRMMDASLAEIADRLRRSEKSVTGLLRRAAQRLSELLPEFSPRC